MKLKQCLLKNDGDPNIGILILRLFIGAALLSHGWSKLGGGFEGFTGFVASLGVPAPQLMAGLAVFAETGGAVLLLLGLLTCPAALMIVLTMAVAIFGAHGGDGFSVQEAAWLYLVPSLLFLLKGAGKWSLDWVMGKRLNEP
jgi:putative oxidoreductase